MTQGSGRVLSRDVATHPVAHEPLPTAEVEDGTPSAGVVGLSDVAGAEVGLWEMTAGTARDTEVDEVFVVLSGRGSVAFPDGEVVSLVPGVAVRLTAGERTVWTVAETLRKVWVA